MEHILDSERTEEPIGFTKIYLYCIIIFFGFFVLRVSLENRLDLNVSTHFPVAKVTCSVHYRYYVLFQNVQTLFDDKSQNNYFQSTSYPPDHGSLGTPFFFFTFIPERVLRILYHHLAPKKIFIYL